MAKLIITLEIDEPLDDIIEHLKHHVISQLEDGYVEGQLVGDENTGWWTKKFVTEEDEKLPTDKKRLDFLEMLNNKTEYSGHCILRISEIGRGWRMHESQNEKAVKSVRTAIDNFMHENKDV